MKSVITYKNDFNEFINREDINGLRSYEKIYTIDGVYKKSEVFLNGIITRVFYEKDNDESIDDVFKTYPDVASTTIMVRKEIIDLYTIKYYHLFDKEILYAKGRIVENSKYELIFSQDIDIITDLAIIRSTKKYYNLNTEEFYVFSYGDSGGLSGMDSTRGINSGNWRVSELETLLGFSWEEVGEYYCNVEPIVPIS